MAVTALLISLGALVISALGYYRSHHHVSRKLFAFISTGTPLFDNGEFVIAVLNAGNSDVVLLGYSILMDMKSGGGSLSRGEDILEFERGFKGLLNPGDASTLVIKINPHFDENIIVNCGKEKDEDKYEITYSLSISWCDSSGKKYKSEVKVGNFIVDQHGELRGYRDPKQTEVNLYALTRSVTPGSFLH